MTDPSPQDTIRAQVEPFDHKALQESMAGEWTSSRGAFRDPRQFSQPVVRGNMKMKTERLEYQARRERAMTSNQTLHPV